MANIKSELVSYRKEIEKLNAQKQKLINEIKKEIGSIKQNGFVKTISNNPCVFTLNSKDLSCVSWDPAYYDNNALSQKVIEKIEYMDDIEKIITFLHTIVENGVFEDRKKVKTRCNENFIAAINNVLKSLE